MTTPRLLHPARLAAVAASALLLAACGGGGGDSGEAFVSGSDVPVSATQSGDGATTFAQSTAMGDASAEPIALGSAELARSETDEPKPL